MGRQDFREFEINFVGLDNSNHQFNFKISEDFFHLFPDSLVEKGKGEAFLQLDKSETMMHLHFHIVMKVELTCDITLEKFDLPVDILKEIIIKFGDEDDELSESISVMHRDSASFNIAKFIYEFVTLEIPMKKIHPRIGDQERDAVIYSSVKDDQTKDTEIDPRWEALRKLKK